MINLNNLTKELQDANIDFSGCNVNGIVWDLDGATEIQGRPDVAAVIKDHDPTPILDVTQSEELAKLLLDEGNITKEQYDKLSYADKETETI